MDLADFGARFVTAVEDLSGVWPSVSQVLFQFTFWHCFNVEMQLDSSRGQTVADRMPLA